MAEVVTGLRQFEETNIFEPLQVDNDEPIADVEAPEDILARIVLRHASHAAEQQSAKKEASLTAYVAKARQFEDGELDDSWTIVASRKTKRTRADSSVQSESTTALEEEEPPNKSTEKPVRRWRRSLVVLGTAAAVGLASFFLNRRGRRNQSA